MILDIKKKQRGTVLIITFLVLEILLLLGSYFLSFTLVESKISKSQQAGTKTYYLAEAGINEAIWKLKNDTTTADGDPAWADDFVDADKNPYPDGSYWGSGFSRSFGDGTYIVTIQNSARGKGEIVTTASLPLPQGKSTQRIVKTTVFKALASPVRDSPLFSGGSSENIDIEYSNIQINKGNIFSNHHLNIKNLSNVRVYDNPETEDILEGQTLVVGNFLISFVSSLDTEAVCAQNECTENCEGYQPGSTGCPPASAAVPLVDFDSPDPNSFKSRAQQAQDSGQCQALCNGNPCSTKCVFSGSEFEDLLWAVGQGGNLALNSTITYVTGSIDLKGGRRLIINGTLIADDNINIGMSLTWSRQSQKHTGLSQITINRPNPTSPSGLLTKRKINFGLYSSFQSILITGVIYANDEIKIMSLPLTADITGGIIGRKIYLSSLWQWFNITLDNDIILYGLGYKIDGQAINPTYSPIITVEHWEETY